MTAIDRLRELIEDDFISKLSLPEHLIASTLAKRDVHEFANRWMAAFEDVNARFDTCSDIERFKSTIYIIRKSSYAKAFNTWKNPELASLISDDMELISKSAVIKLDDPWINGLLFSYINKQVPSSNVFCEKSIEALIDSIA